jgi:hypothetical protein
MPIQRFRSIEDTPPVPWRRAGDPELAVALTRLWQTAQRLRPRRFPPGVYKHRTMEDMNRQRHEWASAYVAAVRAGQPREGDDGVP